MLTVAAKVFLFFQMMTVFPLIMYLLRVSVLFPIYKNVWPGRLILLFFHVPRVTLTHSESKELSSKVEKYFYVGKTTSRAVNTVESLNVVCSSWSWPVNINRLHPLINIKHCEASGKYNGGLEE